MTIHGDPPDVRRARRIVDEYECRTRGHSWDVVETFERPTHIICGRCGETYAVAARS